MNRWPCSLGRLQRTRLSAKTLACYMLSKSKHRRDRKSDQFRTCRQLAQPPLTVRERIQNPAPMLTLEFYDPCLRSKDLRPDKSPKQPLNIKERSIKRELQQLPPFLLQPLGDSLKVFQDCWEFLFNSVEGNLRTCVSSF